MGDILCDYDGEYWCECDCDVDGCDCDYYGDVD
jgi:hypothetical protein